jgi:hypothetical protein
VKAGSSTIEKPLFYLNQLAPGGNMKVRILKLSGAVVISSLMFLAFFTVVSLAAPAGKAGRYEAIASADVAAVKARDFITITISGVDGEPLRLIRDGQLVLALGKVECSQEGTYNLRVMVFQQKTPRGIATGEASGVCSGDESEWREWQTEAVGTLQLTAGEAQICTVVVVHSDRGATTKRSCRIVSLVG